LCSLVEICRLFLEEHIASIFRVEEHAEHVTRRKRKNAEPADESSKLYKTYYRIPSQDAQLQLKGSHLRRLVAGFPDRSCCVCGGQNSLRMSF
jgi:hypothetical protein